MATALLSSFTWSGGSAAAAAKPNAPARCVAAKGGGPGYDLSIGSAQNGKTVCVTVGQKVLVLLSTPVGSKLKWSRFTVTPPGILAPAPLTLMLVRNVTAQNFLAKRVGLVRVASVRPACPPPAPGQASCGAIMTWQAHILVRAALKPIK